MNLKRTDGRIPIAPSGDAFSPDEKRGHQIVKQAAKVIRSKQEDHIRTSGLKASLSFGNGFLEVFNLRLIALDGEVHQRGMRHGGGKNDFGHESLSRE